MWILGADSVENTSTHSILKDADPYDILAIWSALTEGRTAALIRDNNAIAPARRGSDRARKRPRDMRWSCMSRPRCPVRTRRAD